MEDITPRHLTTSSESMVSWHWKDILLISSASVILLLGGFGILKLITYRIDSQDSQNMLMLSLGLGLLEAIAIIVPIYVLGLRRHNWHWIDLGLRPITCLWFITANLLGGLTIVASGVTAILIQLILKHPLENPQLPFLAPNGFSWFGAISMFFIAGILIPFAEELFFRGMLYQWLRRHLGVWSSILLSAFIFAVLHGELSIAGAAFVSGIILAWTFEYSQSLWASFTIHAINNGMKILLLYALLGSGFLPQNLQAFP